MVLLGLLLGSTWGAGVATSEGRNEYPSLGHATQRAPRKTMSTPSPVNPRATPEARALLAYLYSVNGKVTLTGQHNQMPRMGVISEKVEEITGKYPLVWGGEWGFSDARNNTDDIKYRPKLLDQMRAQHKAGRILVMTYHQASPTVGEPCLFRGGVQLKLTDAEWDEILTKGTRLHRVWEEHVDRLAAALASLRDDRIPVIFRPYHEMNGGWFWWGGNALRFKALWLMTYNRYVNHHRLDNLLWAWNPDKPYPGVEDFYPGDATVDLLGTDIYPDPNRKETYPQEWYDRMKGLAGAKPLALSENSVLPDPAMFDRQPWTYFMAWDNMVFGANTEARMREVFADPRMRSVRE